VVVIIKILIQMLEQDQIGDLLEKIFTQVVLLEQLKL
jgi:hypothetical protein